MVGATRSVLSPKVWFLHWENGWPHSMGDDQFKDFSKNIRQEDLDEADFLFIGSGSKDYLGNIVKSAFNCKYTVERFAFFVEGVDHPVFMCWVARTVNKNIYTLNAIATTHVEKYPVSVMKGFRRVFKKLSEKYPNCLFTNAIDPSNKFYTEPLRRMGAIFHENTFKWRPEHVR